jgi:hypothetical protein
VSGWLLRQTALHFLRFGFDWVAVATDGLWEEARAREFVEPFLLEGAASKAQQSAVHHITLDPGEREVARRMASRAQTTRFALDEQAAPAAVKMLSQVRRCYGPWTHVIDNGDLTPAATARAIYEAVDHGAGRLYGSDSHPAVHDSGSRP